MSSATATRSQGRKSGSGKPSGFNKPKAEPEVLFQTYFKSVGPRTYAAQIKRASNENQFLVLTEGKRDDKTGEVRKTRLFIFSEDFEAYLAMLREAAQFMKANPVSPEVRARQAKYWSKQKQQGQPATATTPVAQASAAAV